PLAVTFDPAAKISEVTKDGVTRSMAQEEFRSELTAGDIRVFTWNATADSAVKAYPGCVKIFNGENFDGWEADSSTWSIVDGAMRGFAGSSRLAYTKADYGSFRLIFT